MQLITTYVRILLLDECPKAILNAKLISTYLVGATWENTPRERTSNEREKGREKGHPKTS